MHKHPPPRPFWGRALLFALVSLFGIGWSDSLAAQICPMSVDTGTTVDGAPQPGRRQDGERRRVPRKRQPQREGTVETQVMPVDECGSDWNPPSVSISPASGTYTTPSVSVTVSWSDDVALDQYGYYFTLNGVNVSPQFTRTGGTAWAEATGTVTLNPGQNTFIAEVWDQAGNYNSATATYTYNVPIPAPAPHVARQDDPAQVSQGPVHPGSAVQRQLCLTIAVGPGAAYECGDLRLAHSLPTTRVLNTARTPTLIYNSQHAQPRPVVPFNLQMNAGSIPSQVRVILWVGEVGAQPTVKADTTWTNPGGWQAGLWRFAASFDGSSYATRAYTYRLQVVSRINGQDQLVIDQYGDLAIVNRAASALGAGWWVAGLEQLIYIPGDGSFLVVGGDGSSQRYYWINNGVWRTAGVERPDTLWASGSSEGSYYYRNLPNGSRVWYNPQLRHHQTITRLGYITQFRYDGQGRVDLMTLPKPAGTGVEAQYVFGYDDANGGRLDWVCAIVSGTNCRNTHMQYALGDRRVTGIRNPDSTLVQFGYDGAGREVKRRTDRRSNTVSFLYDAGGRLKEASLPVAAAGYTIRHGFWAAEAAGLAPLPTGNAYTRYDAPRTDLADDTYFWVNRWGAPTRIQDAGGGNTYLTRSDSRFPGLVTRVDFPGGRYVTAGYDALGNLEAQTDWSHTRTLSDGSTAYSTSRYARTDPAWPNFVTQSTAPEGEVTRVGYHANGSRAWQQPGDDVSRRVRFDYNSLGLVEWVTLPATATQGEARERLEYDARGNLLATSTPNGYRTVYHNDVYGRHWKTESPIDGVRVTVQENTFYPNTDLVEYARTIGPDMNGAGQQTVTVRSVYDQEGNPLSVARRSDPDPNNISWVTTRFRYDAASRKVAEIAPDGMVDSTYYDPAGNPREVHTRRRDASGAPYRITMEYDALGRLRQRQTPEVRYSARNEGLPARGIFVQYGHENGTYPRYPNDGGTGYLIPADLSTFTYTATGQLETANNGDAQVTRTYYPHGALRTETQRIRTTYGADFGQHVYETAHTYDLNGRRTELRHPTQLAPSATQNTTRYEYDPLTGAPSRIVDALGKEFRYGYSTQGEPVSLQMPGGISEEYGYDPDGNLLQHLVRNGSSSLYRSGESYLRYTTFRYDQRGKMLFAGNPYGSKDTLTAAYTGLGQLAFGGITTRGSGHINGCFNTWVRYKSGETTRMDALGNMNRSIAADSTWWRCGSQNTYSNDRTWGYVSGVGRLAWTQNLHQRDITQFDAAGNSVFETQEWYGSGATLRDRASFYGADGTLRAAESRMRTSPNSDLNGMFSSAFEEYRYDALGRRVWVRARRYCENDPDQYGGECNIDKVRRTVWDGDDELYEIQMPGEDGAPMENDTGILQMPMVRDPMGGGYAVDPNPFYGRVAYTHGMGIDRPLGVIRLGYVDQVDTTYQPVAFRSLQPFGILPLWSSRGQADLGVFDDGGLKRCETISSRRRCVLINWPGRWFATERPKFRPFWWHGSVVEDKKDASGTFYRRNRYLDAQTGRFTQEDPIGLAGGLNAYGFAEGDPVSYSDPYGLCSVPTALGGVAFGYAVSRVAGSSYGLREAAVDAALGCVGAIGVRALGRVNSVRRARLAAVADDALEGAGRALSARAAAAGRQTIQQQGDRILTMNRHAATGSRGSRAAHDFASAGLDVNDVANAVARDIGDLSALSEGVARGTVQMGQTTIAYSRNTMKTGETVVNFWIR